MTSSVQRSPRTLEGARDGAVLVVGAVGHDDKGSQLVAKCHQLDYGARRACKMQPGELLMQRRWKVLAVGLGRRVHGEPRPLHRQHRLPGHRSATSPARACRRCRGSSTPTRSSSPRCSSPPGASPTASAAGARSCWGSACSLLGSALCGARAVGRDCWSAARVIQAVGAALLMPTSLALLLPEFPPQRARRRDRHLGGGRRRRRRRRAAARRAARRGQLATRVPRQRPGRAGGACSSRSACCARAATRPRRRPDLLGDRAC